MLAPCPYLCTMLVRSTRTRYSVLYCMCSSKELLGTASATAEMRKHDGTLLITCTRYEVPMYDQIQVQTRRRGCPYLCTVLCSYEVQGRGTPYCMCSSKELLGTASATAEMRKHDGTLLITCTRYEVRGTYVRSDTSAEARKEDSRQLTPLSLFIGKTYPRTSSPLQAPSSWALQPHSRRAAQSNS